MRTIRAQTPMRDEQKSHSAHYPQGFWSFSHFQIVGYPEVVHFVHSSGCPATKLLRPSRGPLAAIIPLFPRLQLPIPLGENLLLMPTNTSSEWQLSLPVYRASVASSCVRCVISISN
jgi:hypothetical protein